MKLSKVLEEIKGTHQAATEDDLRRLFGEYHNLLRWLAAFLIGEEEFRDDYVIDVCTIADTQGPEFHEWLVHWAARATVSGLFEKQQGEIAKLASRYEQGDPAHVKHTPLSPQQTSSLVKNSKVLCARLDLLCRFVLVLHGLGKLSYDDVATQLRVRRSAVENAYGLALDTLELASNGGLCRTDPASLPH